ncbi:hypothetical protein ACQEVZ_04500 [Dactylosporangium sp. CA-152071]|uniref:hypothetical protein n=1 Tax=Dactylosporangium sp. CA-152071 TaxID=3239933 RepID=UPI003D8C3B27
MGFFGTFVLARSGCLLTDEEATLGFGYQHEHLYELGKGWQLLETRGVLDPQDFAVASERFVAATGAGVLALYVNDGGCIAGAAELPAELPADIPSPSNDRSNVPPGTIRPSRPSNTAVYVWMRCRDIVAPFLSVATVEHRR